MIQGMKAGILVAVFAACGTGWTKSDKPAAYQKHVVEDGGAILWSTPGLMLFVR